SPPRARRSPPRSSCASRCSGRAPSASTPHVVAGRGDQPTTYLPTPDSTFLFSSCAICLLGRSPGRGDPCRPLLGAHGRVVLRRHPGLDPGGCPPRRPPRPHAEARTRCEQRREHDREPGRGPPGEAPPPGAPARPVAPRRAGGV